MPCATAFWDCRFVTIALQKKPRRSVSSRETYSANGHEQGYSGWVQLDDGRIFVVHYTDDTAPASSANPHMFGVPWIRGTFLTLDD
ncbi:MAG: hypothetical protein O3C40_22535 [Planctomycetota bacterium]|nr:hypothetical protein [Planctomycetota bacterium]